MNLETFNKTQISALSKIAESNRQLIQEAYNEYLNSEINFYRKGNKIKSSKKPKIHIKKENRGKFTDYCGGKVTSECIQRGKNSSDPKIRKRATFAANARTWKHQKGGTFVYNDPHAEDKRKYDEWNSLSPIDKLKRNFTIAKQFVSESPRIENLYNAAQALVGEYNPQNPYLIVGVAPSAGKTPRIRKQSVSNVHDKGLQITKKLNSAVKSGLTYEDGDARHLNRGRGSTSQQRQRAQIYMSKYRVGTPEYGRYQNLYKKLAKKEDSGADKSVINRIKKEMNDILDNLIDQGYIQ